METLTGLSRVPVALLLALLASVGLGAAIATGDEAEPASMVVAEGGQRIEISCILHGTHGIYGANHYVFDHMTVRGIEMLDDQPAMRVDLDDLDASAWFVPGVPIPVRIAMDWELDGRAFGLHYDLTGFERGTLFAASEASAPAPVPASGPLQPWGIDTGDAVVVFPGQEAHDALLENGVEGFLDRAGAFTAGASRSEREIYGVMQRSWAFDLHAGTDRWVVDVTEEIPVAADTLPASLREQVRTVEVTIIDRAQKCALAPSDLPNVAPHMQAAIQRWRAQGGVGEANAWGHRLVCGEDGPHLIMHAGESRLEHLLRERTPERPGDASFAVGTDMIVFSPNGTVHQHLRIQWSNDGRVGPTMYQGSPESPLAVPDAGAWISPAQAATAGAFGILVGLLYASWPLLKTGPLALFSRLRRHELLDHPQRSAIHDLVMARPGIHFNQMQRTLAVANGTLHHHLQMLVRQEVLVERPHGRYTCYFVRGQSGRTEMALAATVKSAGAVRVLDALRAAPGSTAKHVADMTGLSPGTVAYHVKRLQAEGLLDATRDGRSVRLQVA